MFSLMEVIDRNLILVTTMIEIESQKDLIKQTIIYYSYSSKHLFFNILIFLMLHSEIV